MKEFELLKFRSMHWSSLRDESVIQAAPNDTRVTPVGRILRRTSLDELPQLINVLRGDMSLIGPRPHAVEHDLQYIALIPRYRERFCVRPGLTGLAQVKGARGATPRINDMVRRISLDLLYIKRASLFLDIWILIVSIREVFRSNAY